MLKQYLKFSKINFLRSILLSNFKRLKFPFKLSYAVTYKCNLRCKMCNIWKKIPAKGELNISEISNFFERANRFSWVGITGGEPFLRPDLEEIIDAIIAYCKKLCVVHFATNGQLTDRIVDLTRHIHKRDRKIDIAYTVSIDGPQALHNEIRGAPDAWRKAIDTFKRLKDMGGVNARFGFTISPSNLHSFEETYMSLKEVYPKLKFDDITVNIFQKSSFYYENQNLQSIDNDKLINEINKILKMDKDNGSINNFLRRVYLKLYLKYINTNKCPLKCQALSSTCFLDPYGNLFPCSVYNKRLFDIKDASRDFVNTWNTDYAKRLSYECSNYMCPSCWSPCDAYSAIIGSLKKAVFS